MGSNGNGNENAADTLAEALRLRKALDRVDIEQAEQAEAAVKRAAERAERKRAALLGAASAKVRELAGAEG